MADNGESQQRKSLSFSINNIKGLRREHRDKRAAKMGIVEIKGALHDHRISMYIVFPSSSMHR